MMSSAATGDNDAGDAICASCGITGGDNIKLKNCAACKHVKYCSVDCQRNHRPQHKRACKKRAAELKDELLFKQPESAHLGDCPICFIPISLATTEDEDVDEARYSVLTCCGKVVCIGCVHANILREIEERLPERCPFCRQLVPKTEAECLLNEMKRVKVNDPVALFYTGIDSFNAGDYATAIEYLEKVAGLGHIESHQQMSRLYKGGIGYEKDLKKSIYHAEVEVAAIAIGGHSIARHNLASWEAAKGNTDRAIKHLIIAVSLGLDHSLQSLKNTYALGEVSKEDFTAALRAHQAAVDATKSPQRDAAEAARKRGELTFL